MKKILGPLTVAACLMASSAYAAPDAIDAGTTPATTSNGGPSTSSDGTTGGQTTGGTVGSTTGGSYR